MTPAEKQVWLALYAAAWFQPMATPIMGAPSSLDRASWCAGQASVALCALRELGKLQDTAEYATQAVVVAGMLGNGESR